MTRSSATSRARSRKLSPKQLLRIVKDNEVDRSEDDAVKNLPKVESGVDPEEDREVHLQRVIRAHQEAVEKETAPHVYIPTPDAGTTKIKYDDVYEFDFPKPATYIRFSSTLEDCTGCQYNMTGDDDIFLKSMNQKRNAATQCNEEQFEEVMSFFEETTEEKQPFANVDGAPVLKYGEFESFFDETISVTSRPFAKEIYDHWCKLRLRSKNSKLQPVIKVPRLDDDKISPEDEADAYTCFRRPKPRASRRTRGRDAQSAEKLKKLRKELEDARQLMSMVKQRESLHKEVLAVERQIFEQRSQVKEVKRKIGIKGDDEDLVNQKPRRKIPEQSNLRQPQQRMAARQDGRSAESDLVQYRDVLLEKENDFKREMEIKCLKHKQWNDGWIDATRFPLTPKSSQTVSGNGPGSQFRAAVTEYFLPTPPASVSSQTSIEENSESTSPNPDQTATTSVRYASPPLLDSEPRNHHVEYRRRIGRGGRIMIDRRGMKLQSREGISQDVINRFKFDQDSDDGEEIHEIDPYDSRRIGYRTSIYVGSREYAVQAAQAQAVRRAQLEAAAAAAAARTKSSPNGSSNARHTINTS